MSLIPSSDEDIGAPLSCNQVILQKWNKVGYAWKRGESTVSAFHYGGRDFWNKVLRKPRKADNESEERICWGREFQMVGGAK